jgi:hypothetical protein
VGLLVVLSPCVTSFSTVVHSIALVLLEPVAQRLTPLHGLFTVCRGSNTRGVYDGRRAVLRREEVCDGGELVAVGLTMVVSPIAGN